MRLRSGPRRSSPAGAEIKALHRRLGYFLLHCVEMCLTMAVGTVVLSLAFFSGAALIGYPELVAQVPCLSAVVLAVNVSVPMVAWMRFRHNGWQPTLEMAGARALWAQRASGARR